MKKYFKRTSHLFVGFFSMFHFTYMSAQQIMEIPLWPNGTSETNEITAKETQGEHGHIYNVSTASLTLYLPKQSNGKAIIACPGGGYYLTSSLHEGHLFSNWLNKQGFAYAVLKYRLPNGHHQIPISDAQQAIRILRQHAQEWNIKKIGVMGFSAGGHLASTVATHFTTDRRPDFQILFYPVISLQKEITHWGTRKAFLGESASQDTVNTYSNELQVTAKTPPAFIVHCSDDPAVPVTNSLRYYEALQQHKVPVTLHCYPVGGHGWGFKETFPYRKEWMTELSRWLKDL